MPELPDEKKLSEFQISSCKTLRSKFKRKIQKIVISKRIIVQRWAWNHFEDIFQQIFTLPSSTMKEMELLRQKDRQLKKKRKADCDQYNSHLWQKMVFDAMFYSSILLVISISYKPVVRHLFNFPWSCLYHFQGFIWLEICIIYTFAHFSLDLKLGTKQMHITCH